jgi:Domain of unknown function (DUF4406)
MNTEKGTAVGLTFIDILFAVVVGVGLTEVTSRPWVTDFLGNWRELGLWVFIFGITVVVASWVGYHKMMAGEPATDTRRPAQPLDPEIRTWQGFSRFIIDIVLLFLYYRLLVRIDHPLLVLSLVLVIFVLYVAWDCVVITEQPIGKRGGVTVIWTVFFLLVFLVARYRLQTVDWLAWLLLLIGCICGAVAYRLHKWRRTFLDPLAVGPSDLEELIFGRFRKRPTRGMRVYVAGPYTAMSEDQALKNVQVAIDASLKLYEKGHQPYVPHLTHYIDKRAQELRLKISRDDYVRHWDGPWLALCDAVLYLAESPGAREELQVAQRLGMKVFYGSADEVPAARGR